MKSKPNMFLLTIAVIAIGAPLAFSNIEENKGTANFEMDGGTRGKVPFPHHQHQESLGDCTVCHSLFPQKTGSIEELKEQGKLKKKYVMNKLCTKCHKEAKKAGRKSGPTTCSKCHIRSKS